MATQEQIQTIKDIDRLNKLKSLPQGSRWAESTAIDLYNSDPELFRYAADSKIPQNTLFRVRDQLGYTPQEIMKLDATDLDMINGDSVQASNYRILEKNGFNAKMFDQFTGSDLAYMARAGVRSDQYNDLKAKGFSPRAVARLATDGAIDNVVKQGFTSEQLSELTQSKYGYTPADFGKFTTQDVNRILGSGLTNTTGSNSGVNQSEVNQTFTPVQTNAGGGSVQDNGLKNVAPQNNMGLGSTNYDNGQKNLSQQQQQDLGNKNQALIDQTRSPQRNLFQQAVDAIVQPAKKIIDPTGQGEKFLQDTFGTDPVGQNQKGAETKLQNTFGTDPVGEAQTKADEVIKGAQNEADKAKEGLQNEISKIGDELGRAFENVGLPKFIEDTGNKLGSIANQAKTGFEDTGKKVALGVDTLGKNIEGLSTDVFREIGTAKDFLDQSVAGLGTELGGLRDILTSNVENLIVSVKDLPGTIANNISNAEKFLKTSIEGLGTELGGLGGILKNNLQGLISSVSDLPGQIGTGLTTLGTSIGSQLEGGLGGLLGQISPILGDITGGLGKLGGDVLGGIGQLGTQLSTGLMTPLSLIQENLGGLVGSLGNLPTTLENSFTQLKNLIESNTRDLSSGADFFNTDTGKMLIAGSGLPLISTLLGGAALGGAATPGLPGLPGLPDLSGLPEDELKDFLYGTRPRVDYSSPSTFTGGQTDLFNAFAGLGPQAASTLDASQLGALINKGNFNTLPRATAGVPTFTNSFAKANLTGGTTLPNIPTSASSIQTDFLSSLLPGKDDANKSILDQATTSYATGLGYPQLSGGQDLLSGLTPDQKTATTQGFSNIFGAPSTQAQSPLSTFQNLQDITGQTQALDNYFTQNIQDPLVKSFQEDVMPAISRRYAGGNQFYGSERQRADELATRNLSDELARQRSQLGFQQFNMARDRALQAASQEAQARTASQGLQVQEALGRGGLALQDLLGRGGLILEQGLGTQGQQLQANQIGQQGSIASGQQLLQAIQANQAAEQMARESSFQRSNIQNMNDRLNLEAALQQATGRQQAQTSTADIMLRAMQANQAAQLQQNAQLAQILGIPQMENIAVSLPGTEGLLQGILAGGAQALGSALPMMI